jgi:hypothetical protein
VYDDIIDGEVWWTTQTGYFEKNPDKLIIKDYVNYRNPKATYKIYSSDSSKLKISEKGVVSAVNGPDGDYVWLTIKETYKKTTRTVGKFKGYMYAPYGDKETTWYVGEYYEVPINCFAAAYICWDESQWTDAEIQKEQDYRNSAAYVDDPSTGDDNSLLKSELDDDGYLVDYLAQKTGTAYFYIYLKNYNTNQYEYLGYPITVKIEEEIDYDDYDDYDEDDDY